MPTQPTAGALRAAFEIFKTESGKTVLPVSELARIIDAQTALPELISAAEDLADIGEELYDMDCGPKGWRAIEKARSAIAKSKGQP